MIIVSSTYCLALSCWNQLVERDLLKPKKNYVNYSAPGAFSFWRGRYIEDSFFSASGSRSSSQNKSSKEKSSRSPLRATTLESNVKKCSRVEFREPLASYRLVLGQLTVEGKHAKIRLKLTVVFLTTPQKLVCFLPSPTHMTACGVGLFSKYCKFVFYSVNTSLKSTVLKWRPVLKWYGCGISNLIVIGLIGF